MEAINILDSSEDTAAEWARRKETIRDVLKQFRLLVSAVKKHAASTQELWQVSSTQLRALHEIGKVPGMRVMDLAKTMAIHAATAGEISDHLIARGLLLGEDALGEGKSVQMFLTDRGSALIESAPFPPQGVLTEALENVDDKVLAELNKSLQAVVNAARLKENQAALTPLTDILQPPAVQGENGTMFFNSQKGDSDDSTD